MELELGLKITRTREDVSSSVDFRFSKDPFGPLVLSRETESRFIIIIHLKGFKKEGIEIDINKEGNRITIRGRKPVEELVLIRWMAWRKEVELRTFRKVYLIPDVVDLDKIKARFDDDDSTLTITMPKRVKGISGLKIEEEEEEDEEEEEEEEEEDASEEAVNREEIENREEADEDDVDRIKSDECSETEIQRQEEFGEIMGHKERESQTFEGEEESVSGGLDEKETEDDNLEKIHQIDQQNKILESKEDEKFGQPELTDSNTGSEDRSLKELPDIQEERDSHDQTRHEEQENNQELVVDQRDSQAETKSDDILSRAFGEIEEQEPDEQLDTISTSGATEKKTINDDGDDGSRKVQGTKEPERKIQEMVEGETGGHEKKKNVKMDRDAKEEVDGKTGERITTNIEKTQVDGKDDIAETEKKEEENDKVGRQSKDRSLIELQENAEQHSKGQKRQDKQEKTKELVEEKIPEAETNVADDISGIAGDEEKQEKEEKKIVKMEIQNGDGKKEIDAKLRYGSEPKFSEPETEPEECESETLKADEEEEIQKLDEKKEENAKMGTQSEDIILTKLHMTDEQQFQGQKQHDKQEKLKELVEEKTPETEKNVAGDRPKPVQESGEGKHKIQKTFQEEIKTQPEDYREKIDDAGARKVKEIISQQELVEPERCKKENKTRELVRRKTNDEEKEVVERETKERGSNIPKILGEQEKIQELADEKTKFSEKERVNEKKTEVDDDYISRKVGAIKQREPETMKGEEEKDKNELERGEKVSDGGKGIIAVSETIAENYESRKVQEIDEQQSHEEETCGNQKLRREASGLQEVEDVENEKKTTESEKRIKDSIEAQDIENKDSDISGKYIKGTKIQEIEENRRLHPNKHEEEKKSEADKPEKITSVIEKEFGNLNGQLEQDNIEAEGERTRQLVEEEPKDCKEEEARKVKGNEESNTKTNDDVVRKVQGTQEQELSEPKREHVSKIIGLVEEKETAESEIEAEYSSLRKLEGSEEQELHEPKIHREGDKTLITGTGQPSGQEIEEQWEIIESEKMAENENSTHIQETNEKQSDKLESHEKRRKIQEVVVAKEEQETEEDSSKNVQEIENQESDELKRTILQAKRKDREEKDKTREMEGKEMVEGRKITKDGSLRKIQDDDFLELSKPHKRQQEDKIQELFEKGRSDYREKVKKLQDGSDILRSQEAKRRNLDETKRHSEQRNIPQFVEDDSSRKSYEDWTHEEQEKRQNLVKEEETDSKDKNYGGVGHKVHKEQQHEENVIAKSELKTEEDNLKKVQETEKQECNDLKRSVVNDQTQETEEKDKIRAMGPKDIVERRTKTKDSFLGKVPDDGFPEPSKSYKRQEEGKVQELVETDYREKVKKQEGDDILRSQEAERSDLDGRNSEQRNISQLVEDDSSGKLHEFEELKSYEEWTHEEGEKIRDFKEEATAPRDKYTSGEGHNDHKEKQEEENVIAKAELKTEDDIAKNVEETEQQECDKLNGSVVQDKMQETKDKGKTRAMEENEIVERRERTKEDSLRKVREGEDPETDKHKKYGEVGRMQELVETVISDHRGKNKKRDEDGILRRQKSHQLVEARKGEGKLESNPGPGGKMEGDNLGKLHDFQKQRSSENWRQEESEEVKNLVKGEATDPEEKHTGGGEHEEERYETVAQNETKAEDDINKKVGENKEPELVKQKVDKKLDKLEGVLREAERDCEKEENLLDDFTTEIQETEKEELHESERRKKLDIIEDVVEDETEDQGNEAAEEATAVVAENEKGSSGKHKEQYKIPKMSDPEVKEEGEGRVPEKEAHVQEPEGKRERWKDGNSEGRRGEQEKTVKSKSDDRLSRKIRETKVQESNENKNQESEDKIEELERKETSNHEKKLMTEDDSLRKGQEFLKKDSNVPTVRPVEQKKIQEMKEVEKQEDEEKAAVETNINDGNSRKFQKQGPEKQNEKISEEAMQDEINSRVKDQGIKGQEPYELLKNGDHNKTPEHTVKGTKYHREEEKEMEDRDIKAITNKTEDVSSRKVQKIKAKESEKHRKLRGVQENDNIEDSMEEKIQGNREEEMKGGGYKCMASSDSQDVEENGSIQPEQDAQQVKVQELKTEKNVKEEYDMREREQMEKAKNETEILRGKKKQEKHQELVETGTSDQRKEENEKDHVQKAETIGEDDSSRMINEHGKGNSDKVEREIEAIKRKSEDVSSRKVQQIKAEESEKHGKQSEVQDNENIRDPVEEKIQGDKDGEMKEGGRYKHMDLSQSQDVEEKGSYQPERGAEQVKIQDAKTEKRGKEEYDIKEGEQREKAKIIPQVESKANDDSSKQNETEILKGKKKKEKHQDVVEPRTSDQRKEANEEDIVRKAETIDEDDSSGKILEHEKGYSGKVERQEEEEIRGKIAEEEINVDKEGNRAGAVSGETKITNVSFGKVRETKRKEQDKKKPLLEEKSSSKGKEKKNQETKSTDDSSRKTNEKHESHEQNRNEEQDKKNLELVGENTNYCKNEEDGKEAEEIAEQEMVERNENQENIKELVEETMDNQEKEDKKIKITKQLEKDEDHETKGREGLRKQDQSKELEQRLSDDLKDEATADTETKDNANDSRKIHQIKEQETSEQERPKEQGMVKELVEDRTHAYRETQLEDGSLKKIQKTDKKESIGPRGDEKQDEIQEPVDRETSEDDEEELEIEFEEEEEEWEAEVIQEMDSDEDNNKLRKIRRIKVGFRLVGGSALFMSLIVIVIRFIHSKRKIRRYKF